MLESQEHTISAPCLSATEEVPSPSRIQGPPPSKSVRNYEHKKLQNRHHRLAELAAQGLTNNAIAAEIGMSASAVSLNLGTTLIKQRIAEIRHGRDQVIQQSAIQLKSLTPMAVNIYEKLMNPENDELAARDKIKAAKDVIEMNGLGAKSDTGTKVQQIFISAEELKGIQERSSESPKYIEAEFEALEHQEGFPEEVTEETL